ncbi:DUF2125 domain-containing protein [Paracoccus sp. S3-43]|uniref:DUF2125 domain-containing protein n=1 Tax=Paracoccus sp. S3-43 TaxID=3030011 RepID=UPI0023B05C98|nr:DUF2125 domain-containing protein [Paracoccus sp. S3-43]WEF24482.1 DUF2125 domain-containing protein [Paracoccus sp. S3-43]
MVRPLATSLLALTLGAGSALADVTPAQVWENLQKYSADYGYQVSGNVEDAGGTLTVTDAVFTMAGETGASSVTFPKMTFQETGDAKVRVTVDGDVALDSRFTVPAQQEPAPDAPEGTDAPADPAPAETVEMTVTGTIKVPGNEMVVSGTPEDMLYEYTYPTMAFDFILPTEPGRDATIPVTGTVTEMTGSQRNVAAEGGIDSSFDMKAAQAEMRIDARIPGDGTAGGTPGGTGDGAGAGSGTMDVQVAVTNLTGKGTAKTPGQSFDLGSQMAQALAAGLVFDTTLAYETLAGSFDVAGKDDSGQDQNAKGSFASGASDIAVRMSGQGLGYKAASADAKAEMTVNTLPFPISYAVRQISAEMLLPVSKGDAAQPFKFAYVLDGLTFSDAIWNLFDPTSQLPRDPASLTVDLSGDAVVTQDLFDPALAQPQPQADAGTGTGADAAPEAPFAPKSLTVNKVALDAVGAKADIAGTLEFGDNPNEPVGKLNGSFEGVNGLMDKLVTMGLVPQEQMMGMRMMLAMFAKPVDGQPDQLTSEIEFREGGSIFANGQQVK